MSEIAPVATPRHELEGCSPQEGVAKLSNGEKIALPLCNQGQVLGISALVPLEVAQAILPESAYAVDYEGSGMALVTFYFANYERGTIKPYREVLIGVWASDQKGFRGGLASAARWLKIVPPWGRAPKEHYLQLPKLYVDQEGPTEQDRERAILAGNEEWGLNKDPGDIEFDTDDLHFALNDSQTGELIFAFNPSSLPEQSVPGGQNMIVDMAGQNKNAELSPKAEATARGVAYERPLDQNDEIYINPHNEWVAMFAHPSIQWLNVRWIPGYGVNYPAPKPADYEAPGIPDPQRFIVRPRS